MIVAIVFVAVLLLVGLIARSKCAPLRKLFIPSSVVAGFIGLLVVSLINQFATEQVAASCEELTSTLSSWPGLLIAVVFAAMLLQPTADRETDTQQSAAGRVALQGLMVWIIVLGETAIGLLVTWLVIQPRFDVPNSFGMLIETGFAGGHGTAAAMGAVFSSNRVGFDLGLDLGLLMATCGLVYGLVSGIVWINLAARWGWIEKPVAIEPTNDRTPSNVKDKKPIGYQAVSPDTIDPLLLQMVWIVLALGIAVAMQATVLGGAAILDQWIGTGASSGQSGAEAELSKRLSVANVADLPLFIYAMIGGWLVRRILTVCGRAHWLDAMTIARLNSTSMEILVVAAITSLKISAVLKLLGPFLILFVAGAVWTAICLLFISRIVLPRKHWFQLGVINYGMSTGTTATGFVLLRLIDPDLGTDAASDYALAAPLSSPFIGGGIVTIGMPLLFLESVSIAVPTVVLWTLVIGLVLIGRRLNRA